MSIALAIPPAYAQQPSSTATTQTTRDPQVSFDALAGRWVRVEGGYVITVRTVAADGKLDASYANPRQLPFYTAAATDDHGVLRLLFELRAGGYDGSTYTLNYDAASDQLKGEFNQVVARQRFAVTFIRERPR